MSQMQIRAGDTSPSVTATLTTSDAAPINLTGATVRFVMRHQNGGAIKVNHQLAVLVTPAAGTVRYDWQAGDTDTVDIYDAGFVITFGDGTIRSVPSSPPNIKIAVNPPL